MPKLSVIVSFDVTEPCLGDCLSSLRRQTLTDRDEGRSLEVVLVPVRAHPDPDPPEHRVTAPNGAGDGAREAGTARARAGEDNGNGNANGDRDGDGDGDRDRDTALEADAEGEDGADTDAEIVSDTEGVDDEDSEVSFTLRGDAVATARDFAAAPPAGLEVVLVEEEASDRAEARQAGTEASSAGYLMFLEGADTLSSYALAYLVDSLESSGSDLATGNVYRFNELGARPSRVHRKIFGKARAGVDVRATASLLADRLYGNKVWRRSFWQSLPKPDPRPHDNDSDLAVVRALFAARGIDVLPGPVLLHRDRESDENPMELAALTRRVTAITALSGSLHGADRDLWDSRALRHDLRGLLLGLDDADDRARGRFLELVNAYLGSVGRGVLDGLSPMHRLTYHLMRKRQDERLMEVVTFQKSVEPKKAPVVRRGLHYYIRFPFFEDPDAGVPRSIYRLGPELRVRQKTERVEWRDGKLVVSGRVGILYLRAGRRWQQQLAAFAVNVDTGRRIPVRVRVRRAAEYRLPDVPDAARHDYGGFEITLDPARLRISGEWRATEWRLELVVINRGLVRRRVVANPVAGSPRRPPYRRITGDVWVRPSWNRDSQLSIAVAPVRARVLEHRVDHSGDRAELEVTGELVGQAAAESHRLLLTRLPGTAELRYPIQVAGSRFTARVPVADLLNQAVDEGTGMLRQVQWQAVLTTADGDKVALVFPEEVDPAVHPAGDGHHEVAVQRTSTGFLRLRAGWAHPVIHGARWTGRQLELTGHYAAESTLQLVFKARGREEEHPVELRRDGSEFQATFAPADISTLSGTLSLPAGSYQLWGRVGLVDGGSSDVTAEIGTGFVRSLPLEMETAERAYTFADSGFDTPVLKVDGDLMPEERGAFAQKRLREVVYPSLREKPLREEILFDSYTGRQFSDSPQSIQAELRSRDGWADSPMSWLVKDGQVSLPDDLSPVRHNGRDFYEALARSRYLVTNSRQPAWFARRPGQVVVQTWHGSMLKRIGFDIENIRGKTRDYHEKLAWETRQWDYLVSPSPWATPILRRAFRFEGEILETGYPRNDIFFAPQRAAIAERTRQRLGLPAGKKVVLYAPTWRDDKYYTRGKHKLDLHLDLRRMYDKLGDDHVLLIRRHPRVVDSVPIVGQDFVYDVSMYPEIQELFLITDVLVTDYSSMMFDFANTGRPMLFFTYDIESYRDNLRGFYFDFEETAPGPLLLESDDVIESLLGIDEVASSYAAKYTSFTDQFCPLDDGHAAARVVDRVFGRG